MKKLYLASVLFVLSVLVTFLVWRDLREIRRDRAVLEAAVAASPVLPAPRYADLWKTWAPGQVPVRTNTAPGPEVFNPSMITVDPDYSIRAIRNREVYRYLNSPVRNSQEFRAVAALCEQFGLGPWAVPSAYNFAYEYTQSEGSAPDDFRRFLIDRLIKQSAEMLNIKWDPTLVDAVLQIRTTAFGGHTGEIGQPGDKMLDQLDWQDLEARQ